MQKYQLLEWVSFTITYQPMTICFNIGGFFGNGANLYISLSQIRYCSFLRSLSMVNMVYVFSNCGTWSILHVFELKTTGMYFEFFPLASYISDRTICIIKATLFTSSKQIIQSYLSHLNTLYLALIISSYWACLFFFTMSIKWKNIQPVFFHTALQWLKKRSEMLS